MKIALLGYGKMGQLIEKLAQQQGDQIAAKLTRYPDPLFIENLQSSDVCIDFSHASCIQKHVNLCAQYSKNLIIGTTGWEDDFQDIQKLIKQSQIGCLYAPNFSIGIHLFSQIIAHAARLIDPFDDYDVSALETHHRQKTDTPSGTAKALTQQILNQMKRVDEFHFTSIRSGYNPGMHTIQFDGPADTIILTHQARSREGFAHGALKAAKWIVGKQGFFTIEDFLCS